MSEFVVKSIDPNFKRLLETVRHTTLCDFSPNGWKKTCIEGPLYIYNRSGEPTHNIIILSKSSTQYLIEPITAGLELQLINMLLVYKTEAGIIHGIWFCEEQDMVRIASVLGNLISQAFDNKYKQSRVQPRETRELHVVSPTVLTKPQEECCPQTPINILKGTKTPKKKSTFKENGTIPQNVLDFFSKASSRPQFIFPDMPIRTYRNIIQQLKANPIYSVEYIEAQQMGAVTRNEPVVESSDGFRLQSDAPALLVRGLPTKQTNVVHNQNFLKSGAMHQSFPTVNNVRRASMSPPMVIPSEEYEISARSSPSMAPSIVQSQQFFNSGGMQQLFPTVSNARRASMPPPMVIPSEDDEMSAGSSCTFHS